AEHARCDAAANGGHAGPAVLAVDPRPILHSRTEAAIGAHPATDLADPARGSVVVAAATDVRGHLQAVVHPGRRTGNGRVLREPGRTEPARQDPDTDAEPDGGDPAEGESTADQPADGSGGHRRRGAEVREAERAARR